MTDPLPTFKDWLEARDLPTDEDYSCVRCNGVYPTFAFVEVYDEGGNWDGTFQCSNCHIADAAIAQAAAAQAEREAREAADPWDCEAGRQVRQQRNIRLEMVKWALDPLTSPLAPDSIAEYQEYVKKLHRLTVDFPSPADVVWPVEPEPRYS